MSVVLSSVATALSRTRAILAVALALMWAACAGTSGPAAPPDGKLTGAMADTVRIPLTDMGARTYKGFSGGLYPDGSNTPPAEHAAAGLARAREIRPVDVDGNPSAAGKYVLLSIGMSNTTQEFCSGGAQLPCDPWTFMGRAASDPEVNHTTLVIANGARGGQAAGRWDSPDQPNYDRIRDQVLAPQGLSEQQVQVAWVKLANPRPTVALPAPDADAYRLETQMGDMVRALKARYPNLQQVFLSSRIYAGYATTPLNPEPYAYESGFAVKWLVEAQMQQRAAGGDVVDDRAGNLDHEAGAPWLAWGPYLWADGVDARSDGLVWERRDFAADGTHPATPGRAKVGAMLHEFFKSSPSTRCWFLAGETCRG